MTEQERTTRALEMFAAYEFYRDQLAHISRSRGYTVVNRDQMARILRKFVHAMDRAMLGMDWREVIE